MTARTFAPQAKQGTGGAADVASSPCLSFSPNEELLAVATQAHDLAVVGVDGKVVDLGLDAAASEQLPGDVRVLAKVQHHRNRPCHRDFTACYEDLRGRSALLFAHTYSKAIF